MRILAHQNQHKDFNTAVQILRKHGIVVTWPYRRRNGTFVFSVADCVVTEDELLCIQRDGKPGANDIQKLFAQIDKRQS